MERVLSVSKSPAVGFSRRLPIPVFACILLRSKMLAPVTSLPVPAVVATAISGFKGPRPGSYLPMGVFT
jgi:hypothetical protein